MGIPGLADEGQLGAVYGDALKLADKYIGVAAGELNSVDFANELDARKKD